jgi:hypothetical protein
MLDVRGLTRGLWASAGDDAAGCGELRREPSDGGDEGSMYGILICRSLGSQDSIIINVQSMSKSSRLMTNGGHTQGLDRSAR